MTARNNTAGDKTARSNTVAVVVNPVGAQSEAEDLRKALASEGIDARWIETTEDDPGRGQAEQAAADGADVVIACGGDGTVRACIEALAGSKVSVAIVPAGTGNLLARNLDIPPDVSGALDVALHGEDRTIDVGYLNNEAFAVMAGTGLDGVVMEDTSRESKNRFGALAYVGTALQHLTDSPFGATLTVDDEQVFQGDVVTVLLGNMGGLQGGIDIFPNEEPQDGVLGVLAVRASSPMSWLRAAWDLLRNRRHTPTIDRWSGAAGSIHLTAPQPYQLDGEERDASHEFSFCVRPQAITVRVPKEAT